MNPEIFELPPEQQFSLERMRRAASGLSEAEAKELLINVAQQLMVKDNMIRDLLRNLDEDGDRAIALWVGIVNQSTAIIGDLLRIDIENI